MVKTRTSASADTLENYAKQDEVQRNTADALPLSTEARGGTRVAHKQKPKKHAVARAPQRQSPRKRTASTAGTTLKDKEPRAEACSSHEVELETSDSLPLSHGGRASTLPVDVPSNNLQPAIDVVDANTVELTSSVQSDVPEPRQKRRRGKGRIKNPELDAVYADYFENLQAPDGFDYVPPVSDKRPTTSTSRCDDGDVEQEMDYELYPKMCGYRRRLGRKSLKLDISDDSDSEYDDKKGTGEDDVAEEKEQKKVDKSFWAPKRIRGLGYPEWRIPEKRLLLKLIEEHGVENFDLLARHFPTKSAAELKRIIDECLAQVPARARVGSFWPAKDPLEQYSVSDSTDPNLVKIFSNLKVWRKILSESLGRKPDYTVLLGDVMAKYAEEQSNPSKASTSSSAASLSTGIPTASKRTFIRLNGRKAFYDISKLYCYVAALLRGDSLPRLNDIEGAMMLEAINSIAQEAFSYDTVKQQEFLDELYHRHSLDMLEPGQPKVIPLPRSSDRLVQLDISSFNPLDIPVELVTPE